jgi:lysophospholipase L1-like esterase
MTRLPIPVILLCLVAAFSQLASAVEPEGIFFFKPNDRIVFLGDSITEQYQYSSDIELYLTTRFPKWNLTYINAGIGGDTASGGANRFAAHVLAEKPTAVTINFGMNDGGYGAFDKARNDNYVAKTKAMLDAAKAGGVRVALISPNAVDRRVAERFKLYVETQKQFYAPLKGLAEESGAAFVDQYAITRSVLEKMEAENSPVRPFGDGFHTSTHGGLLMAHAILTGLNAPALVSSAEIDAAASKATVKRCTVEKLSASADSVSFDRTDESLPMPIAAKEWAELLPNVNDLKDLNWYGLKVSGLASGTYTLSIDGKEVGKYDAPQLAAGVNLGNLTTGPIFEQSKQVFDAINAKNQIVHQRFRGVVMFQSPDWLKDVADERKPKELASRMEKINAAQAEIYKLATPKTHRFTLAK